MSLILGGLPSGYPSEVIADCIKDNITEVTDSNSSGLNDWNETTYMPSPDAEGKAMKLVCGSYSAFFF